jgi:dUTP pyrophosphatase
VLNGADVVRRGIVTFDARVADVDAHVQPNGIDLSIDALWRFTESGALGVSSVDRVLPTRDELPWDGEGWIALERGTYGLRYGEWVELPVDCGGLCFPRSSLLRMGVHVPTAVWDAGYAGRGEGLLVVENPHGLRVQQGARVAQLVVFRLTEPAARAYAGQYQHEGR